MSDAKLTIYHNPTCSKSRETLEILTCNGKSPKIIEYLREPPTREALEDIVNMLGISPAKLVRKGEQSYQDAGFDIESMSDGEIIEMLYTHPVLLQRPIVVSGNKAVIGRPPSCVLDII